MKVKVAILLTLTLLAITTYSIATSSFTMPELSNVPRNATDNSDPPAQPLGDPIDDDEIPH